MTSDEALYERLVAGQLDAFDELYARYARRLFGFLRLQLGNTQEAEDVLHETFLAILREREHGHSLLSFRAWIYQIARNICLNRARTRKRAKGAFEQVSHLPMEQDITSNPCDALEQCQTEHALRRAVEQLPPALSEIYRLRAAGLSQEELSQVLSIPIGTVKSRTHEMIRALRQEMQS